MNYSKFSNYISFHNYYRNFMRAGYFSNDKTYTTCYVSAVGYLYVLDSGKVVIIK